MEADRRSARCVQWVLVVGAVLAVLLVLLDAAVTRVPWAPQWRHPDSSMRIYFDSAREQNLPTWVNVCLLTLTGAVAAVVAALARAARDRSALPWAVFALTCAALSLDDMTSLHERLDALGRGALGGGRGLTYAAWVVPGLAVAALVVVAVAVLVRRTHATTRRLLVLGLGCLLVGAFGLESLGNAVLEQQGFGRSYAWFVAAEELLETFGAVLLLAGALSALRIETLGDGVHLRLRTADRVQTVR